MDREMRNLFYVCLITAALSLFALMLKKDLKKDIPQESVNYYYYHGGVRFMGNDTMFKGDSDIVSIIYNNVVYDNRID